MHAGRKVKELFFLEKNDNSKEIIKTSLNDDKGTKTRSSK